LPKKEKSLTESDKGSWFGQPPSTISASTEDLEQAKILGASSLRMKVNASACCEQDSSSESGGSDEEKEDCDTYRPKYIPTCLIDHSPLGLFRASETNN